MEPTPASNARLDALVGLLDDPEPRVRAALLAHFQALGDEGRDLLRGIVGGRNRVAALHASWYLMELKFADPVSEFRSFIRSMAYELEMGVFLLARTVHPELDIARFCVELDRIAARCRELMVEPLGVHERCKVINRVLFHELGFRGNIEDYADPGNSFLHLVLERRKGLPITLSILYILVAGRCGLELEPVGLPGHFVVGCYQKDDVFYIDAFDRGRFLGAEDLINHLAERKIPLDESWLAPTTIREVLCRCCRNLASHFTASKNPPLARLFSSFVDDFENAYEPNASS